MTFPTWPSLCALALSGCASVVPAGLREAARLDPLAADPAVLSAAVAIPDAVRLDDGDATLTLRFTDDDGAALADETFALALTEGGVAGMPAAGSERVYTAAIAAGDRPRLVAAQERIRAYRAAGGDGEGSLSVGLSGGCAVRPLPERLIVRTAIRTTATGDYVPLTLPYDLFGALSEAERTKVRSGMPACDP